MISLEQITGWLALATTLLYVSWSYPRELLEAIKGRSSMTVGFQLFATLTFGTWCLHSICQVKGTNFFILTPNLVGFVFAGMLTGVLMRKKKDAK